ncbi:unnamed protein product [Camellia sinensis]
MMVELRKQAHSPFPMALVGNTADLIRLLPPLAIVLNLAFLSLKHLRSIYDDDDSRSFPFLPIRISSLFGCSGDCIEYGFSLTNRTKASQICI